MHLGKERTYMTMLELLRIITNRSNWKRLSLFSVPPDDWSSRRTDDDDDDCHNLLSKICDVHSKLKIFRFFFLLQMKQNELFSCFSIFIMVDDFKLCGCYSIKKQELFIYYFFCFVSLVLPTRSLDLHYFTEAEEFLLFSDLAFLWWQVFITNKKSKERIKKKTQNKSQRI